MDTHTDAHLARRKSDFHISRLPNLPLSCLTAKSVWICRAPPDHSSHAPKSVTMLIYIHRIVSVWLFEDGWLWRFIFYIIILWLYYYVIILYYGDLKGDYGDLYLRPNQISLSLCLTLPHLAIAPIQNLS